MEARIARLEASVLHIQGDIVEIKAELRELRKEASSNFRWLLGIMSTLALAQFALTIGLAGMMARGFGWL